VADPERKLSALPPRSAAAPARGAAAPGRPQRRERVAVAVLAALLAASAIGLAMELRRNARLEARLVELSGELVSTRAALGAHEARLDEVRDAVARLNALVQGDPLAAPAGAPEP
jgi:hypothetical protein